MKFKYIPGERPTPMLAYNTEPNLNAFNECVRDMDGVYSVLPKYDRKHKHYWNMNAYLIIDEEKNEIIACAFIEFMYVIYLLRVINKEFILEFGQDIYDDNIDDFEALADELVLVK